MAITATQAVAGMQTWTIDQINAAIDGKPVTREFPHHDPAYTFPPAVVAMIPRREMLAELHRRATHEHTTTVDIIGALTTDARVARMLATTSNPAAAHVARCMLATQAMTYAGVAYGRVSSHRVVAHTAGIKVTGVGRPFTGLAVQSLVDMGFRDIVHDGDGTVTATSWEMPLRFCCAYRVDEAGGEGESAYCGLPDQHGGDHGEWLI